MIMMIVMRNDLVRWSVGGIRILDMTDRLLTVEAHYLHVKTLDGLQQRQVLPPAIIQNQIVLDLMDDFSWSRHRQPRTWPNLTPR
jgi:hypothetical protein